VGTVANDEVRDRMNTFGDHAGVRFRDKPFEERPTIAG